MNIEYNQFEDIFFSELFIYKVNYLGASIQKFPRSSNIKFIYEERIDSLERKLVAKLDKINQKLDILEIVLIASYSCNMRCVYCYQGKEKKNEVITYETIDSIGEIIQKYISDNPKISVKITLLGGEPLQEFNLEIFNYFFKFLKDNNILFETTIITNGINLNLLDNLEECYLKNIQVTLDGYREIHNKRRLYKKEETYDLLLQKITNFFQQYNNKNLVVRINVDLENINDNLLKLLDDFEKLGFFKLKNFYFYFYPVQYNGVLRVKENNETKQLEKLLNLFLKYDINPLGKFAYHGLEYIDQLLHNQPRVKLDFCSMTSNQLVFDCSGKVYTCWWGADNNDFLIGGVDSYNKENHHRINQKYNINCRPKCINCKYKLICGGGCKFIGTMENQNFKCSPFYENIELYINFLERKGVI